MTSPPQAETIRHIGSRNATQPTPTIPADGGCSHVPTLPPVTAPPAPPDHARAHPEPAGPRRRRCSPWTRATSADIPCGQDVVGGRGALSAMATPANANGHRRRQLIAQVLAESDTCGICDQHVDKTLTFTDQHGPRCTNPECQGCIPHPMRAEVDEIIPRSLGGSPLQRSNTHMTHRRCNSIKAGRSLEWARAKVRGESSDTPVLAVTNLVDW